MLPFHFNGNIMKTIARPVLADIALQAGMLPPERNFGERHTDYPVNTEIAVRFGIAAPCYQMPIGIIIQTADRLYSAHGGHSVPVGIGNLQGFAQGNALKDLPHTVRWHTDGRFVVPNNGYIVFDAFEIIFLGIAHHGSYFVEPRVEMKDIAAIGHLADELSGSKKSGGFLRCKREGRQAIPFHNRKADAGIAIQRYSGFFKRLYIPVNGAQTDVELFGNLTGGNGSTCL